MTTTQPHDSLTCNRDNGRACAMCRWANKSKGLHECVYCFEWFAMGATHVCGVRAVQSEPAPFYSCAHCLPGIDCGCPCHNAALATMGDNGPPPNFESAWATAPREYSRYTEESHALYWYLRGMQDEQRITKLARRSLAREDTGERTRYQ